jgi:adenylosuccinate synthase
VTKLDVLSMFERIPVCTGYRLTDGTVTTDFPSHQTDFHHAQPVYEELAGWSTDISAVTAFGDLPDAARAYLDFVEERVGVPVTMVGIGQRRDQTLTRRELAPAA